VLKILPEEVGDMRVILKAGVQPGRDPDFAKEIGSLIVPFQYYQHQSLIWSWPAENASFTKRITETGTQFGQVDIIHSTDPVCINCPGMPPILYENGH
jgi:hypothetical protein